MEEFLLFVEEQQAWFYGLLVLAGILYLRSVFQSFRELRAALFRLERERARARMMRSIAMLLLILSTAVSVFIVTTFASPALSMQEHGTPLPTVSLIATAGGEEMALEGVGATGTPPQPSGLDTQGCENPNATIAEPQDEDSISGVVTLRGAANVQNFAFYKIEYRGVTPEATWMAILAGTETVCEEGCQVSEELGTWDTSLVTPGDYLVRLVVTDTAGNAPLPCTIRLKILPPP